jgi:hypothetical protein
MSSFAAPKDSPTIPTQPPVATVPKINLVNTRFNDKGRILLSGTGFQEGDLVLLDEQPVDTDFVSKNSIEFFPKEKLKPGSYTCQIKRTKILSNKITFVIYLIKISYGYQINKLDPGNTRIRLVGEGFQNGELSVWSKDQIVSSGQNVIINGNSLEFVLNEHIKSNELEVKVGNSEGSFSNDIVVRINTLVIAVFGDSIAWGQGLSEDQKFYSIVARDYEQNYGLSRTIPWVYAHSGAGISTANNPEERVEEYKFPGEIPSVYPTIPQQVDAFNFNEIKEEVDLIFIDGGINDVSLQYIFTSKYAQSVRNKTAMVISQGTRSIKFPGMPALEINNVDMEKLLKKVKEKFNDANPTIILTGYYQIVSEDTDLLSVLEYLSSQSIGIAAIAAAAVGVAYAGLLVAPILSIISDAVLYRKLKTHLTSVSRAFYETSSAELQKVSNNLNQEGGPQILFVDPRFEASNAMFTPNTLLWGGEKDSVRKERETQCKIARDQGHEVKFYCDFASIGHPNVKGAERYAQQILGLLNAKGLLNYKPKKPDPCASLILELQGLNNELKRLQNELNHAPEGGKSQFIAAINSTKDNIKLKQKELDSCRQQNKGS